MRETNNLACQMFASRFRIRRLLKLSNRELKTPRRRRQQERHKFTYLTMKNNSFARFARAFFIFRHFAAFSFFPRGEMTRFAVAWTIYAHVIHTSAKQVISSRRKNENVLKMSKDEKCTCKACKNTVFHCQICKFVEFLLPSSSRFLKLPNREFKIYDATVAKTSLKIASSSFSIYFAIMSVCLTFES